jgi:hypothetical protein
MQVLKSIKTNVSETIFNLGGTLLKFQEDLPLVTDMPDTPEAQAKVAEAKAKIEEVQALLREAYRLIETVRIVKS